MTDNALPAPPVPITVDLSDFDWMPLDVRRLRDSETASKTKPEEFRAAVMLWCAAWHQVPASSLPDDDAELAKFAGYGQMSFSVREFRKVKVGALRGFVKCADGRLYHLVIAKKAITSWISKLEARYRGEKGRVKTWNHRHPDDRRAMPPPFSLWISREYPESAYLLSLVTSGAVTGDGEECNRLQGDMYPETSVASEVRESSSNNHHHDGSRGGAAAVDNPTRAKPGRSNPSPKPGSTGWQAWVKSEGERLGMKPGAQESWDAYGARVRAAVDREKLGHREHASQR